MQAQWLTRGVLETAWSGVIDKMVLYELLDKNDFLGGNTYSYSGLMTQEGKAKRSWYYIMTLKKVLGDYEFDKEIFDGFELVSGNPSTAFSIDSDGNLSLKVPCFFFNPPPSF